MDSVRLIPSHSLMRTGTSYSKSVVLRPSLT
jgi:hypothetical protein